MFTHARPIPLQNGHSNGNATKSDSTTPRFDQYPALLIKSVRVVRRYIYLPEYFEYHFFLNLSFLVLDGLFSVRSAVMDGNTLVVGFEFVQVE